MARQITKLQAVNIMLGYIGNAPVNSLNSTGRLGEQALSILEITKSEILQNVWWFNTNKVTLTPDLIGNIYIPDNTIDVLPVDTSADFQIIGNKLFNLNTNDFIFDNEIEVEIIFDLEWDELLFMVQNYITLSAAKVFYSQRFPKNQIPNILNEKIYNIEIDVERTNFNTAKYTLANNPDITNIINK